MVAPISLSPISNLLIKGNWGGYLSTIPNSDLATYLVKWSQPQQFRSERTYNVRKSAPN